MYNLIVLASARIVCSKVCASVRSNPHGSCVYKNLFSNLNQFYLNLVSKFK
jgi:hypothetical protein